MLIHIFHSVAVKFVYRLELLNFYLSCNESLQKHPVYSHGIVYAVQRYWFLLYPTLLYKHNKVIKRISYHKLVCCKVNGRSCNKFLSFILYMKLKQGEQLLIGFWFSIAVSEFPEILIPQQHRVLVIMRMRKIHKTLLSVCHSTYISVGKFIYCKY